MNAAANDPDTRLALAARNGDPDALDQLCERLRPRLLRSAVYVLGPQDADSEDVAQEALLLVARRLDQFDPAKAGVYTWASHITVRLGLRRLNKRRRLLLSAEGDFEALLQPRAMERQARHEAEALQAEQARRMHTLLDALDDKCRRLLQLRLDGKSTIAIGLELKLAIGTVLSRLHRCRQALSLAWHQEEPVDAP